MKNIITFLVFCLAINSQAQTLEYGIKAGLNYADQTGAKLSLSGNRYEAKAISSFHAGVVAEMKVLDKFSLQGEFLYSTQGAKYENAIQEFRNELGYISLPVLIKIYLSESLSLELGAQASVLLSKKDNFDYEKPETFEFGAAGGLGYKLTKNLFLQMRYVGGLTEATKNATIKNAMVQFSAGVMF